MKIIIYTLYQFILFDPFQIAVFFLLALSSQVHSSGGFAPHIAAPAVPVAAVAPALRYRLVAPQNIRPFAAQVSTFSKGLNVFAAPYAAGVLSGPAIVPRAVLPGIPPVPPVPVAPAPVLTPAIAPLPAVAPAAVVPIYTGFSPAPTYPVAPLPVPAYPTYATAPVPPVASIAPIAFPSSLLPGPFHRSVHSVSSQVTQALPHAALL